MNKKFIKISEMLEHSIDLNEKIDFKSIFYSLYILAHCLRNVFMETIDKWCKFMHTCKP